MARQPEENQRPDDLYIIAIGASAGGMEAIHLLFDNTPEDGVAYVIIQHLSPDHKSFMAELLAKHSKLQISVAEHNMYVEPNHIYLMPQGKNMTIKGRRLQLSELRAAQTNTAIDIFLDSLADERGDRSVAVILSGTGSDGTKGIAAIKQRGGFVVVQDPESAKFDGMPNSAIESGNADVALPPHRIPDEIIAHLKRQSMEDGLADELTRSDENSLVKILELIRDNTPLDFSDYKRPTILRRIVIRMTENKVASLKAYAAFLEANPDEINLLANQFMISVTRFFRDKAAFEVIRQEVIPEIVKNKLQVDTLKVWVVGCATGEEAYSLAILIMEHLTELKKSLEVKIFASDIDKEAVRSASGGEYPEAISTDVSEKRLNKFFTKHGSRYKVRDNIRKMIIFADHDIVKQPPYGKIDLISCRNMLIYVNPILQKKILSSLHFCLNLGGYLFLGPSESPGEVRKYFEETDRKWKIFKNIEVVRNLRDTTYSTPRLDRRSKYPNLIDAPKGTDMSDKFTDFVNLSLLEASGYDAVICVNTDFEIKQTSGGYDQFLLPIRFNFNLLEMLPEALSMATSTALRKALKTGETVAVEKVSFSADETARTVDVYVKPFPAGKSGSESLVLVLFRDKEATSTEEKTTEVFEIEAYTKRHIEDLNQELAGARQELEDARIALDVSNDNLSSYNEELISSNEEMQSTNEELQSVNEELQTVNNEYQLKIRELAELNDELNNYFKSTINAQLYVDRELILRKFTPSAVKQVNVKDSDIGRPLSDISTNIRFSNLMDDIGEVLVSFGKVEREVQTTDRRWYQMVALPYIRQQENDTDGVIITFHDITELKKVQQKLSRINEDHNNFIYSVSHDLKAPLNNLGGLISCLNEALVEETDETKHFMNLITDCAANLTKIVKELADITKIEEEIDVQQSIDLEELLEDVKVSLKDVLVKSDADIRLDLEVREIPFSGKNLRSILTNLLTNACKYRSPDRSLVIEIATRKADGAIILSVKDNGIGIPNNKKDLIFGIFKRAHDHVEGSGIGLYLVKKILANSGGDIQVESEQGEGTEFKVRFTTEAVA